MTVQHLDDSQFQRPSNDDASAVPMACPPVEGTMFRLDSPEPALDRGANEPQPAKQDPSAPEPCPLMERLLQQALKIAHTDLTTLLTGESGTGKTTIARFIHDNGPRADAPFVVVNCASLPRELIEAELFGHSRGAFTGAVSDREGRVESADGGTLLLDEIGDMPLELQPKLLTFLQDQTFQRIGSNELLKADVRVIAATNQNLVELCGEKRFREDLYFRLNVLGLNMPPLRDRPESIASLTYQVLERIALRSNIETPRITEGALTAISQYGWPGNIRELENLLERACVFRDGLAIQSRDLAFNQMSAESASPGAAFSFAGKTLADIEKLAIAETLDACRGNKAKAARKLGISERSIYNKLKRYNLTY